MFVTSPFPGAPMTEDNLHLIVGVRPKVCMLCTIEQRCIEAKSIAPMSDFFRRIDRQEDIYICDDHMDQWESSPEFRGEA